MVKVCFVIHSLQPGGTQRVMVELINYFIEEKEIETHLLLYGKSREIFYSLNSSVIIHKPDFTFTPKKRFYSSLQTLWYVRKQVLQIDPAVILSMGEYWNSFVLLALLGLNFPVYVSDRCRPDKSLGRMHDRLRKWLYPKAAGIVAQTSKAKEIYEEQKLNTNIRVISNPIHPVHVNGNGQSKQNIILTVGRLIKSKHHDRLIKMFKVIQPADWKLVIAGGDALKESGMHRLKTLVDELDMNDCVELTGTVSDIASYYRQSKIFAFTSSSEGFPNVIGEAMSAGLPVIAYDCMAGPSDLVKDEENGFLIPLFNDEMYLEKLKDLVNDEHLRNRMGEASKKLVQKFSAEKTGEEYYLFMQGLI